MFRRSIPATVAIVLVLIAACGGPHSDSELLLIRTAEETRDLGGGRLLQDLSEGTKPVRAAAARALGRIGNPAARVPLETALDREGAVEVRREIAFALGILAEPQAVPALLNALDKEVDAATSGEIAIALGRLGDTAALDALHGLLQKSSWGLIRERTIEAMALIADARSVPVLIGAMEDPDPGIAWRAAYALEKIEGEEQVPALVEATRTSEPLLRRAAVRSLGRLAAKQGVEAIVAVHDGSHQDWHLDVRIADALGRIGEPDPATRRVLGELLESENFHVRVAALQAIGRARFRDLLPAVLDLRADPVVDVRAAAFDATADCLEGRGRELLWSGLDDASPIVVSTALHRLGENADAVALSALLDTLSSSRDRSLRLGAARGLAAAGESVELVHLFSLLEDRDLFVATTAAAALGDRADASAVPHLLTALDRSDRASTDLRIAAATALGQIGDDRAVDILRTTLIEDDDPRLRRAALEALGELLPPEEVIGLPDADEIRRDVRPVTRSPLQPAIVLRSSATELELQTDRGRIVIELFGDDAPQMVESFASLAEDGFFDELTFHRVVGDFVIQGGDPTGTGWGDAGYTLRSEWNPMRYERGTVGIAHSGKDTGSCQLFIAQSPQPHLDGRYTIWGQVVTGMDVVDRIQRGDRFHAEVTRRVD